MNTDTCGPCNGQCNQGRQCPAHRPAEACTDIGADPAPHPLLDARGGLLAFALSAVAVVAAIAAIWPH